MRRTATQLEKAICEVEATRLRREDRLRAIEQRAATFARLIAGTAALVAGSIEVVFPTCLPLTLPVALLLAPFGLKLLLGPKERIARPGDALPTAKSIR